MLVEKIYETKQAQIKQMPVHTNRASQLGHPCERYLVYERTKWQEKTLHGVGLQLVFDLGNIFEDVVLTDLKQAGFTIVEQQRPFFYPDFNISGHIDAKILIDGKAVPLEIKSASPYVFNAINSINDMKKSKYVYMQKYPAQLNIYMLMSNIERGVFIFKNKSTGQMKEIWCDLDWELADSLCKKAQRINEHVVNGTLPEPVDNDAICEGCEYVHICLPERAGKEMKIIDDTDFETLLDRYDELKKIMKEYDELDREIKARLDGVEKLTVGHWFIERKLRKTTRYELPDELKAQYAKEVTFWVTRMVRV